MTNEMAVPKGGHFLLRRGCAGGHPGKALRLLLLHLFAISLVSCDAVPSDLENTLDKVDASKVIRVGLANISLAPNDRRLVQAYLARLERATGATAHPVEGASEPLLAKLETGQIDLVVGEIALDSPWAVDVTVVEPLAERRIGNRAIGLSPIARNGENRWIMLLEQEVRDMRVAK